MEVCMCACVHAHTKTILSKKGKRNCQRDDHIRFQDTVQSYNSKTHPIDQME